MNFVRSDETEKIRAQIDHPTPIQGRWKVDAIDLPPEILRKLYRDNAHELIWERKLRLTGTGDAA